MPKSRNNNAVAAPAHNAISLRTTLGTAGSVGATPGIETVVNHFDQHKNQDKRQAGGQSQQQRVLCRFIILFRVDVL